MNWNRQYLYKFLIGLTCITFSLRADSGDLNVDLSDLSNEKISAPLKQKSSPFNLNTKFDAVAKTEIDEGFFKGDIVQFAEGEVDFGMIFYYCNAYTEGAQASVSYTATLLDWHNNPWFDQDHFYALSLTLGGFSKRVKNWLWRAEVTINADTQEWDLREYANYDLVLWGRYDYCRDIGIHIGLLAQTGMLMDRVWPILGADWKVSKNWKLNLVFPVDVSLEYILTRHWTLVLAGRNFNSRYRVGKHEAHAKSLIRYQNVGAEFAIKYEDSILTSNIHVGTTLGGDIRIADRHNNHPHHYKLRPSGYVGAEVAVKF